MADANGPYFPTGFTDGSVVLTKGDITRDRHSKTLTLHEGTSPVTGLAFRQVAKVTHLFVATLERVHVSLVTTWTLRCVRKINLLNPSRVFGLNHPCARCPTSFALFCPVAACLNPCQLCVLSPSVQCYTLSIKEYPKIELDTHGCALRCSSLADPSQDSQFIVAGDECVYLYQPDERGPCFAFDGHKLLAHWHRGYLFLLIRDPKSPNK